MPGFSIQDDNLHGVDKRDEASQEWEEEGECTVKSWRCAVFRGAVAIRKASGEQSLHSDLIALIDRTTTRQILVHAESRTTLIDLFIPVIAL